jgi:hypothetical protein
MFPNLNDPGHQLDWDEAAALVFLILFDLKFKKM